MKHLGNTATLAAILLMLPAGIAEAVTLLYSENFNGEASPNYNGGTTPETNVGGIGVLQSSGVAQTSNATNTAWQFSTNTNTGGQNGLRFGASPGYNWSTGANAALILADGGFSVSYNYNQNGLGAADDWMSVRVGNGPENTAINAANVDFGVLTRGDGRMQTFESSAANDLGIATPVAPHNFTLVYAFNSWDQGSTVNFTGFVDGVQIGTDTFDWNGTNNVSIFFGGRVVGSLIDNIQISTIPEPSAVMLSGFCALGLLRRRRP